MSRTGGYKAIVSYFRSNHNQVGFRGLERRIPEQIPIDGRVSVFGRLVDAIQQTLKIDVTGDIGIAYIYNLSYEF